METVNYQKQLEILLADQMNADRKPSLLLHSCCGPCSTHCLDFLKNYFDITVFYYNPNIYPQEEYEHRLSEQSRLIDTMNAETGTSIKLISPLYDHEEFLKAVKGLEDEPEGGKRCTECFKLRLGKSAELALSLKMDYFATTLTVSPHKNAILINKIGNDISSAMEGNLSWLPSDFKKRDGYMHSIELSKQYGLYRQNYCGCEFSIWF